MRLIIAVLLLLISFAAYGIERVAASQGGDYITISDRPCESKIKAHIKQEYRDQAKHVVYTMKDGKKIAGCWLTLNTPEFQGMILMAFEDGDYIQLPESMFHPKTGPSANVPLVYCHARGMEWKDGLCVERQRG